MHLYNVYNKLLMISFEICNQYVDPLFIYNKCPQFSCGSQLFSCLIYLGRSVSHQGALHLTVWPVWPTSVTSVTDQCDSIVNHNPQDIGNYIHNYMYILSVSNLILVWIQIWSISMITCLSKSYTTLKSVPAHLY
jgi:hypothetical protein